MGNVHGRRSEVKALAQATPFSRAEIKVGSGLSPVKEIPENILGLEILENFL